ncbi:MAG: hypothetical protein F4X77_18820 [Acidobacteriia bacterium]|nr:hypothetical protein [Terriglobia bacterium]MYC65883.1 hypothetical protein [Terriglobia bacterium]
MDLLPVFQWLEDTTIGVVIRESLWLFPVIEAVHLLALALIGGMILVVDLRLLGFGIRSQSSAALATSLHPWLVGGLITMVATGVPMFLSEAIKCYYSPPFWYKMCFFAVALLYTFTVRKRVAAADAVALGPVWGRLSALTSLALWFCVGFSGRWIAFY